jgi:hypothetical protein
MEEIYMFEKNMLPLGSVVILEEGMQKLISIGRGVIYDDPELGEERFAAIYQSRWLACCSI